MDISKKGSVLIWLREVGGRSSHLNYDEIDKTPQTIWVETLNESALIIDFPIG